MSCSNLPCSVKAPVSKEINLFTWISLVYWDSLLEMNNVVNSRRDPIIATCHWSSPWSEGDSNWLRRRTASIDCFLIDLNGENQGKSRNFFTDLLDFCNYCNLKKCRNFVLEITVKADILISSIVLVDSELS